MPMVNQSTGNERGRSPSRRRGVSKRLLGFYLPLLVFLVAGPTFVFFRDRVRDRDLVAQRGQEVTQLQARIIERDLETVMALLLHFAEQKVLLDFLEDRSTRPEIEAEYLRFSRVSGLFDQLRLIGVDGRESIRINYHDGAPKAVPAGQRQSKREREYFRDARSLRRGQIYISRFDLNVEYGRIEEPFKPVIRLATAVFGRSGEMRGILILNYLGRNLLDRLKSIASQVPGWTCLVNREGFYLEGPDPLRSWGFMFEREPSFASDHPEAWAAIRDQQKGSLKTDEGMFSFHTVASVEPLSVSSTDFPTGIKIVSFVDTDVMYAASWHTFERMLAGTLVVAFAMFGVAWRLAFIGAVREDHENKIAASERRLRTLSSRFLDVQETERKRLARDLHDEVGQLATAITIDLKRARMATVPEAKDELIERSVGGTEQLLDSMHQISSRIRSSVLDDLGFEAALRSCTEGFERTSGVPVESDLEFEEDRMSRRVAENVYRIVQEALTNISRHARANEVSLRVRQDAGRISIRVEDDGVGFDPATADPDRIGLLGMRERAELLGGNCAIDSSPSHGTVVEASIPLRLPESSV